LPEQPELGKQSLSGTAKSYVVQSHILHCNEKAISRQYQGKEMVSKNVKNMQNISVI
jgi:hypothetical protein